MLSFKQLFHSPLSPSSRGPLVPLCFLPRWVSPAYLRLLIFHPAILIPACDSSSLAFGMIYSACKLNKQSDQYTALMYIFPNSEPVCCSMSGSHCCFLTCIQVSQEAGKEVRYSYIFKNFPVCCNPQSNALAYSTALI